MRSRLYRHVILLAVLILTGCSTTRSALVNLWVDPRHPPEPAQRVLVVAVWRDPDARAMWEERFAQALGGHDTDAIPSYLGSSSSAADSAAVFAQARREECDGVIVIHEHVLERDTFYIPGYSLPREEKTPRWFRSAGGASEVWMNEVVGWRALHCDVEMWTVQGRAGMVWSGTNEVVDPGDDDHAAYASAKAVADELSRLGLVSSRL